MKYQETYAGLNVDVAELVKKVVPDTFRKKLEVEGRGIELPKDRDLELKVKYDITEEGGSLTLKISWDYDAVEEEGEEEDEECEEECEED